MAEKAKQDVDANGPANDAGIGAENGSGNVGDIVDAGRVQAAPFGIGQADAAHDGVAPAASDGAQALASAYVGPDGKFRHGNPGRPRRPVAPAPLADSRVGDGEDGDGKPVDMLKAFNRALRKYGPERFAAELLRRSPVSASQLLAALSKAGSGLRELTGQGVTIVVSPEQARCIPNIRDGQPAQADDDEVDDFGSGTRTTATTSDVLPAATSARWPGWPFDQPDSDAQPSDADAQPAPGQRQGAVRDALAILAAGEGESQTGIALCISIPERGGGPWHVIEDGESFGSAITRIAQERPAGR